MRTQGRTVALRPNLNREEAMDTRAVSIHMLTSEERARRHFLEENATWPRGFYKEQNRNRCSRRNLLKAAAILLVDQWAGMNRAAFARASSVSIGRKVIVVACGGIRREDSFSEMGFHNIPHLHHELLSKSAFYPFVRNAGVTSHFNTTSSILTGN
jgi:hypothetical protein